MKSWLEFEERFRSVAKSTQYHRIDFQWGDAGEYWRLCGAPSNTHSHEFEALSELAGSALKKCADKHKELLPIVTLEKDPKHIWYRAIKELSGKFETGQPAHQVDKKGKFAGNIFSGTVYNIGDVSANLCLTLHGRHPIQEKKVTVTSARENIKSEKVQMDTKKITSDIDKRKIFVVHGRNSIARDSLFHFLRAIGLSPIEWSQATVLSAKGAPFISEILEKAFSEAQAIVVLITGDDEAKLRNEFIRDNDPQYEKTLTPQARPNVLFEAGMAFGTHPERTIIVELGETRPFSDIAGRHIIKLNNSSGRRQELAQRLESAGCLIDLSGTDWHSAGEFEKCVVSANSSFSSHPIYKEPYYYKDGDEQPFCPLCWETEEKLIHLDGPHDIPDEKPFYRCLKCKNNF